MPVGRISLYQIPDVEMPSSIGDGNSLYLSEVKSFMTIAEEEIAPTTKSTSLVHNHRCVKNRWRVAFLAAALFAVIALAGYFAFRFGRIKEEAKFHNAFDADSKSVIVNFYEAIFKMRLAAFSYTYEKSATSAKSNADWPFVTIPEFESATFASFHDSAAKNYFLAPIVSSEDRIAWEEYALSKRPDGKPIYQSNRSIADGMYQFNGSVLEDSNCLGPHSPIWQVSPGIAENQHFMFDQASDKVQGAAVEAMVISNSYATSRIFSSHNGDPQALSLFPIFRNLSNNNVVASFSLLWDIAALFDAECSTVDTIIAFVVDNTCDQQFTFRGECKETSSRLDVSFIGEGDHHDERYDALEAKLSSEEEEIIWEAIASTAPRELSEFIYAHSKAQKTLDESSLSCDWKEIRIYATHEYEIAFQTRHPIIIAVATSMAFIFVTILFIAYAYFIERCKGIVYKKTSRSSEMNGALIKSMFPSVVRDRVVRSTFYRWSKSARDRTRFNAPKVSKVRTRFNASRVSKVHSSGPIAEQFKSATVFFADIAGFTAWSSQREPEQVFQLLEALYDRFDVLASRFGVFKVETIGDCYMAATGLPQPNKDHALIAAQFASECLQATKDITKHLEAQLGPGTAGLALRIGLHSGAVTGGVLRGEKARFQLFGDTVNTASRMESLGVPGKIQVSQATADLVIARGKQHWITPRKDLITAKGKGEMQTYFMKPCHRKVQHNTFIKRSRDSSQLVTPLLGAKLFKIPACSSQDMMQMPLHDSAEDFDISSQNSCSHPDSDERMIEWNTDMLLKCLFLKTEPLGGDSGPYRNHSNTSGKYQSVVRRQLKALLSHISTLSPDLPYHNFEHASVVAMFANKLMKQGVRQLRPMYLEKNYAIAHFAAVFSVLVMDTRYGQNGQNCDTVAVILDLLRSDEYDTLGFSLYSISEGGTFERAFTECMKASNMIFASEYYRGTNDLQCIVSAASDEIDIKTQLPDKLIAMAGLVFRSCQVAHWFQHWSTFSYWHQRSFTEIRSNFLNGDNTYDPSETWHRDEILFFECRIRELAYALELGGLGGEHLERAEENCREWQMKGKQITGDLISSQNSGRGVDLC